MRGHTLNKKYSWYINWIHAKTFIALIKMTCQDLNALVCSILKVFWDWTFCHIREVEIGQFSLTTIYTIYTWIKINILNGQRFYSSLLLERIRVLYWSCTILVVPVKSTFRVKCTRALWWVIYKRIAVKNVYFPHYYTWSFLF